MQYDIVWKRDYPIPADLNETGGTSQAGIAGWRTEQLDNPQEVFLDIYGLLDHLMSPGNLFLRGRRGTGKTMYLLKGQHQIGEIYHPRNQRTAAVYVDMKALHNYKEIPSIIVRAEIIYREIIKSILLDPQYQRGSKHFNLQDYINRQDFRRRWSANKAIKQLLTIVDNDYTEIVSSSDLDHLCDQENELLNNRETVFLSQISSPISELRTDIESDKRFIAGLREIDKTFYPEHPLLIQNALTKILNISNIDHLIVFVDEFSSPTLLQSIQIPLLDRFENTFDGERLSVKMATVPGTTVIYEGLHDGGNRNISSKDAFETFDFETQELKNPEVIQTGNFEVFLRNLANTERFYSIYLDTASPETGFHNFIHDNFENLSDFLEFLKAGEELPRQLLETYYTTNIIKKNLKPNGKINAYHIQLASRQSLQTTYQSQIRGSKNCEEIIGRIYSANSRLLKIERVPEYVNAIDLLTHWGFIHACPIAAKSEPEFSEYPLAYYYTSYRTEVANQLSHTKSKTSLMIDDLTRIEKDKLKELYPKARPVFLSDLVNGNDTS